MFQNIINNNQNYNLIYTDGSKSSETVTYSITQDNKILKIANLEQYSSVFSAEIIAIYEAINTLQKRRGKYAICTDSLSAVKAIKNQKEQKVT